jgi:5-deoxy-5-amino-3-dehydroquinate synthase
MSDGTAGLITVPVELGSRRYDVLIGGGARLRLAGLLPPGSKRAVVVTQDGIPHRDIDPGREHRVVVVPDGEGAKTLSTIEYLCSEFARFELSRKDVVVAVGGGVVTDLAGFAAASYHRGIAYVNVATSLLGQVDAAVGGKTGVNLPEGKNLVGAFWQPAGVLCDTDLLQTLPPREWASGRGEMAKYAFIGADALGARLVERPIAEQVAACVRIKAAVVAADEREGGRRMVLNYGHTLAHALEAAAFTSRDDGEPRDAARWDLRHGEAVAIGLLFAALLAKRLGRIDEARVQEHRDVVRGFGLLGGDVALPAGANHEELLGLMARDKKAHHDLTFVLDGPAGVESVPGIERDVVLATLEEMPTRMTDNPPLGAGR